MFFTSCEVGACFQSFPRRFRIMALQFSSCRKNIFDLRLHLVNQTQIVNAKGKQSFDIPPLIQKNDKDVLCVENVWY